MKLSRKAVRRKTHAIPTLPFERSDDLVLGPAAVSAPVVRLDLRRRLRACFETGDAIYPRRAPARPDVHLLLGYRQCGMRATTATIPGPPPAGAFSAARCRHRVALPGRGRSSERRTGRRLGRDLVLERLVALAPRRSPWPRRLGDQHRTMGRRHRRRIQPQHEGLPQLLPVVLHPGPDRPGLRPAAPPRQRRRLPGATDSCSPASSRSAPRCRGFIEVRRIRPSSATPSSPPSATSAWRSPSASRSSASSGSSSGSRLAAAGTESTPRSPASGPLEAPQLAPPHRFGWLSARHRRRSNLPVQLDLCQPVDVDLRYIEVLIKKSGRARSVAHFHHGRGAQDRVLASSIPRASSTTCPSASCRQSALLGRRHPRLQPQP